MISPKTSTIIKNPWSIQSIYQLQYFNCPTCEYKIHSKQKFIDHVHESHPESIEHMEKIKDGSLDDVNCPWILIKDFKSEDSKVDSKFNSKLDSKHDSKLDSNLELEANFDNILKVEINDITNSNNLIIANEFYENEIRNR